MILFFREGNRGEKTCELTSLFSLNFHEEVCNMNNAYVFLRAEHIDMNTQFIHLILKNTNTHIHMGPEFVPILTNVYLCIYK